MKRTVFMTLAILAFVVSFSTLGVPRVHADITLHFEFPEPVVKKALEIEGAQYYSLTMKGLPTYGDVGLPELPLKPVRVLISYGEDVENIEVSYGDKVKIEGAYALMPAQQPVPTSYKGPYQPTLPDQRVYSSIKAFPETLSRHLSTQSKHGYRIAIITLNPVEYIPAKGEISYYKSMDLIVRTKWAGGDINKFFRANDKDRQEVRNIVDNPEAVDTYTGQPKSTPLSGGFRLNGGSYYQYVIITNEALKNASGQYTFDDLVNHRISRGLSATIVTTEWIYANYDGTRPDGTTDNQTRIRNFIIDAYSNWGTTYVLLGGDGDGADVGGESGDNIIPARGFYIQAGEETDYNMPADMYYGCLDGSFDHDGDGLYGEPTDGPAAGEVDLFAEVYTGRAPVDSDGELSNLVKKTIEYETTFLKKGLMVGQKMCNNPLTWGGDYKDEIKDGSSNHGYTTVGFPGNWDVDTLYDRDGTWVVDDLISRMNDGRALLNHLGHGSNTSAMRMNNSIVDGLQNSHKFFVYSQTCYAGAFDNRNSSGTYISSDSIGEHFVTTSHGAFAVIMNSRYGWYNPGGTNSSSQHFDREFFNTVFGDDIRELGRINQDSKEDQAWYVTQSSYGRWCCYELNLLGDPAIKLRARDYMERVSVNDQGGEGNDDSWCPSISAEGRYVAFYSSASNLVPGDTNGVYDVFVYDRDTDTIERVSIASNGEQGNNNSRLPSISADGRYVAFNSYASNLVPGDTNGRSDVFVYDRDTNTIERISIASNGEQGNYDSSRPSISADGRYVAFSSYASNLVPGDTNGVCDDFVYDRETGTIERISIANNGEQGNAGSHYPSISADGRYVAFSSYASNLVPGDTNGCRDVFVYDRDTDTIERVSIANGGEQGNNYSYYPSISADGRYVAFHSYASNLVPGDTNGFYDVFVYDRAIDTIERVSIANNGEQGNHSSSYPSISADGRYVAFDSYASNLVPGDTNGCWDVFVYDRDTDTIELVSIADDGEQGNGNSSSPSISANGRYVAFDSSTSNLVPGDTNGYLDIFVAALPLELDDEHGNDASSATPISLDTDIWGNIEVGGDVDFFGFHATAGNTYTVQTSLGTLPDSYIFLYNTDGSTIIAEDDNSGQGQASKILWTCTASGYYYVRVDAYSPSQTGTYSLRVSDEAGSQQVPVITPPGLVLTLLLLLGIGTIGIRKNV